MSYLKHKVYGILFNLFKYTQIEDNRVSFIVDSKESFKGNLDYIKKEFEKRGNFEFHFFYKDQLSFNGFKKLAGSRYIFLNDNFFPVAFMKFNPKSTYLFLTYIKLSMFFHFVLIFYSCSCSHSSEIKR